MKKLINQPEGAVRESLEGMAAAHSDMIKGHFEPNFIYRADAPIRNKVAIISGGGSGHESLHGGFVGMGMLNAACPGETFTSPTPDQMQAYCMKCRTKKEMKDPKSITMKNGRPATQGVCPICGTKMFRIGKS